MERLIAITLLALFGAVATHAQTATVLFKEEVDTEAELETVVGDASDIFTDNDVNMIDFTHVNQGNTLAGNPAFLVDECFFVATASGGGFICEGSAADTNEMLFLLPDLNESDTTHIIVTDSATQTLTNKTINSASNTITITESNISDLSHTDTTKLPLAGGTLTGEVVVDDLGFEFTPGDTLTDCSSFAATGGGIFYDDSEGKFKKCEDNSLSDLDTTGGTPSFATLTGGTNTAAAMVIGTGASLTVSGSGTNVATSVTGTDVITDANVVDTLTASNYLPLAGGSMTGDITLAERSSDPSNPSEGNWLCWMSDGTGSGSDGDVLCKITAGAATKTITLFDFSAVP